MQNHHAHNCEKTVYHEDDYGIEEEALLHNAMLVNNPSTIECIANTPKEPRLTRDTNAEIQNVSHTNIDGFTTTFTVNGVEFNMVYVVGSLFTMGATKEQDKDISGLSKPKHEVTVSSYYIGESEVTQSLWKAVMGTNPSEYIGIDRPVENVSWDDCQEFIKKLNSLTGKHFCLPTEAEWEYAARGGSERRGYKYSGSNKIDEVGWYIKNSKLWTRSVKEKHPNELGIYDMSGNVSEWCQDYIERYSKETQYNPKGPNTGYCRVKRGGNWESEDHDCCTSFRYPGNPDSRQPYVGLRLALHM